MAQYTLDLTTSTIKELNELKQVSEMSDNELVQDILQAYREKLDAFSKEMDSDSKDSSDEDSSDEDSSEEESTKDASTSNESEKAEDPLDFSSN